MPERLQPEDEEQEQQNDIWEIDHPTIQVHKRGQDREVNGYIHSGNLMFCFRVWEGLQAKADPERVFIHAPYPAVETLRQGIRPLDDIPYLAQKFSLTEASIETLLQKNEELGQQYQEFSEQYRIDPEVRTEFHTKVKEAALQKLNKNIDDR